MVLKPLEVLRKPPSVAGSSGTGYPPVFRLLASDGVYEVRTSPLGSFVVRLESDTVIHEGFFPTVPRCPVSVLADTVWIFKERPDTEAMVSIAYDTQSGDFHLLWHGGKANRGSVEYEPLPEDDRFILYAEVHSHHQMPAFFSNQDDRSERRLGLYGVIGHVDQEKPEALFRYASGDQFRFVRAEELFEPAPEVWRLIDQPYT